jgi:branched-chain amino acid aminotransferase
MAAKVWLDGKLVEKNDARVSVYDHALLFGDGVWVGTRIYGGRPFRLAKHLGGMFASACVLRLDIPLSIDELVRAADEAIQANGRTEGYLRVTVTRGAGTLGLDPRKCEPVVTILADDVIPYPRELYDVGLDAVTALVRRELLFPHMLSRGSDVLAKVEALAAGCLESLVLDLRDEVSGFIDGNAFFVVEGEVRTPAASGDPVTRMFVAELAAEAGIVFSERRPVRRDDILAADEVFAASSAAEVIAIRQLDGAPIAAGGEGPITRRLRTLYRDAARRLY